MSAPVLQVPQGGPIAARPRRENLYDTEAFVQASVAGVSVLPFFQNTRAFADPLAGTKVQNFDTNLVGNGGSIPRGHYLRVFGTQLYQTERAAPPTTSNGFDDFRKLPESSYWTLLLGSTPYLNAQTQQVPAGTGLNGPLSTTQVLTTGAVQMGWQICTCYRDLTVPGKIRKQTPQGTKEIRIPRIPIEFAETESFAVNVTFPQAALLRATMTAATTIYMVCTLVSIYLKPLAG
jgi:hypothetical protein